MSDLEKRLHAAGTTHGTDKVTTHRYHTAYARHLGYLSQRTQPGILELGIGEEDRSLGGGSLKMWHEVFPHAKIYGVDKFDKSGLDNEALTTIIGDISDRNFLRKLSDNHGPFDLIVDDASHNVSDSLCAMFELIPSVTDGGYYVVEDTYSSYWPSYGGSGIAAEFVDTPIRWAKLAVDIVHRAAVPSGILNATKTGWNLASVCSYPGLCFFEIGDVRKLHELESAGMIEAQAARDTALHDHLKAPIARVFQSPADLLATVFAAGSVSGANSGALPIESPLMSRLSLSILERIDETRAENKTATDSSAVRIDKVYAELLALRALAERFERSDSSTLRNFAGFNERIDALREVMHSTSQCVADQTVKALQAAVNDVAQLISMSEQKLLPRSALEQIQEIVTRLQLLDEAQQGKIARYETLLSSLTQARGWSLFTKMNGFTKSDFSV